MAILNSLRHEEYNRIQDIINEVLLNRKVRFDIETIFDIIKRKSFENDINKEFIDCSYFYILILNTVDKFVEEGKLYQMNSYYIPVDFIVFVDYIPKPSRLLYLINNTNEYKFVDIINLNEVGYDSIKSADFILCGGCSESLEDNNQVLFQSDIGVEEISNLYHELIKEETSHEDALVLILNHYKVQVMSHNLSLINDFFLNKPQFKKLSRKKIIH